MALGHALTAWRTHRVPALADLVDQIGLRCPSPDAPARKAVHGWWMTHALTYEATHVSALVALAHERLGSPDVTLEIVQERHGSNAMIRAELGPSSLDRYVITHLNLLDRAAVVLDWPDDPRWGAVIAAWLVSAPTHIVYSPPGRRALNLGLGFYDALATRLAAIADPRVVPQLERYVREPSGAMVGDHRALLLQVIDAINAAARTATPALAQAIATCAALVAPPDGTRDLATGTLLWAEVARQPRATAPRLVLADHLLQNHDPRGELIVLQLAGTKKADIKAQRLVAQHWKSWLGDLALLCTRKGTTFRGGMLEDIRIGTPTTPIWVIDRIRDHRELVTVDNVQPAYIFPEAYVRFLAQLPNQPARVGIDDGTTVRELRRVRSEWAFQVIDLGVSDTPSRIDPASPEETFDLLAEMMPGLVELHLRATLFYRAAEAYIALVPKLAARFPELRAIVLPRSLYEASWRTLAMNQPALLALRELPLVQLAPVV